MESNIGFEGQSNCDSPADDLIQSKLVRAAENMTGGEANGLTELYSASGVNVADPAACAAVCEAFAPAAAAGTGVKRQVAATAEDDAGEVSIAAKAAAEGKAVAAVRFAAEDVAAGAADGAAKSRAEAADAADAVRGDRIGVGRGPGADAAESWHSYPTKSCRSHLVAARPNNLTVLQLRILATSRHTAAAYMTSGQVLMPSVAKLARH